MDYQTLRLPLIFSVLAACVTIAMKGVAYVLTGSVGLFSDALESGVNLFAALAAYFSLWYSHRPADPTHAFGHEKIEFFSSGLEGMLVFLAGLVTAFYAVQRLLYPQPLQQLDIGVALAIIASVINAVVAWNLLRVGKRYHSIILEADGHHLMTDVLTSIAIVSGLGLVWLTGIEWLDPVLALFVGVNILRTGFSLMQRSFDGLMDRAWSEEDQNQIRDKIRQTLPTGADFHLLRTRQAGSRKFLDFHLLVDGNLSVRKGHELAHIVEEQLQELFPKLEVTIHIEPIQESSSWEMTKMAELGEDTPLGMALEPEAERKAD